MDLLIVAATEAEIAPFRAYTEAATPGSIHQVTILITGVGMLATAYRLTRHLMDNRYDLIIQAGVGGSFDRSLPLGSVVAIASDRYGDLGAEDHDEYIDIFDMGLIDANAAPHTNGLLMNPSIPAIIPFPRVAAITVNSVSGRELTITQRAKRYNAIVESMEGAAFHYVCLQEEVPFVQNVPYRTT